MTSSATCAIAFYAARDGDYSASRSTFLAHFADTDDFVSSAGVRKLERSLTSAGCEHTFHAYEGTGHCLFESDRPEFDPEVAALAWQRTLAFLCRSG